MTVHACKLVLAEMIVNIKIYKVSMCLRVPRNRVLTSMRITADLYFVFRSLSHRDGPFSVSSITPGKVLIREEALSPN